MLTELMAEDELGFSPDTWMRMLAMSGANAKTIDEALIRHAKKKGHLTEASMIEYYAATDHSFQDPPSEDVRGPGRGSGPPCS